MVPFLTSVADYLVRQSWQIAIVSMLVALLCWGLRNKNAHWRYLLWLVVLAKCLTPAPINVSVGVLSPFTAALGSCETQNFGPGESGPAHVSARSGPASNGTPMVAALPEASQHEIIAPISSKTTPLHPHARLPWQAWLAIAWFVGVGLFFFSVSMRAMATHKTLKYARHPIDGNMASTITAIARTLGLRNPPPVYILDDISQPFVWGWLRGSIYLPTQFVCNETGQQRQAILGHELAHVARWDAAVNFVQILVQAVFFFHPLVWMVNRQLRREREKCCDEMVIAGLNTDPKQYGEAIVNALVAEYQATRVASSLAIAGRLSNIEQRIQAILNPNRRFYRRPSPMAVATAIFCAAVVLPTALVLTARGGSSDSESAGPATPKQNAAATQQNVASSRESGESATTPSASQAPPAGQQMMELPVRVVDADGNPVANARITPWALRSSQGHGPWQDDDKRAGVGPKEVVTGVDGGAVVLYPRDRSVEEQVRTIAVSLYVDHPAFAFINFDIDVPPESKEPYEIKLTPGVPVEVRPLIDGKPTNLDGLFLLWSDGRSWRKGVSPEKTANGSLQIPAMLPGKNSVLAVRLDGERATHFSKMVDFELAAGEPKSIDVPLRPSLRVQGVLSDNVPRPVRQGRVKVEPLDPAGSGSNRPAWFSWAPIQPDGTFTIDAWPDGEPIQVIALCDGYIATSGRAPDVVKNPPDPKKDPFTRPQVFDPGKDGRITISMSPLVRCVATAVDEDDRPLAGVTVVSWPNVCWWNDGSQIYCGRLVRSERLLREREYDKAIDKAFPEPFQSVTDAQGQATLELPAGKEDLAVESDVYELPVFLGQREVRVELVPGKTTEATLRLQPSGTERLGEWDKLAGVVFGCSTREGRRTCASPSVQEKMNKFEQRFRKAKNQRDPQLLSEAYRTVAEAFMDAGDLEEAAKWRKKAADQAAKIEAGEHQETKAQ